MKLEIQGLDIAAILGEEAGKRLIKTIEKTIKEYFEKQTTKEWLSISEACSYAGVSYNTLIKWKMMGLKICEVDGVKRVSKKAIDEFLENHSF